jgi:hypothetical protein
MTTTTTNRGPGRPEIGPPVHTRLPVDLIAWIDERAAACGVTRAALIRDALDFARSAGFPPRELDHLR